jgi:hypothetical protein
MYPAWLDVDSTQWAQELLQDAYAHDDKLFPSTFGLSLTIMLLPRFTGERAGNKYMDRRPLLLRFIRGPRVQVFQIETVKPDT